LTKERFEEQMRLSEKGDDEANGIIDEDFKSIRVRNATNFWIRNRNGSFDDVFDQQLSIQEVNYSLKYVKG
jgi:hypothetical protein